MVFLFRKGSIAAIRQHPFLRFCAVVLLVNLLPYIFSPDTRPRYLFMLYPLLLVLLGNAFFTNREAMAKLWKGWRSVWFGLLLLLAVAAWALPFVPLPAPVEAIWLKTAFLSLGFGVAAWLYRQLPSYGFVMIALAMVMVRFAWNFISIPDRVHNGVYAQAKADIAHVLELTEGYPVHAYINTGLNHEHIWYLELGKQAIYETEMELREGIYYLTHKKYLSDETEVVFTFRQRHQNREIFLVKKAGT